MRSFPFVAALAWVALAGASTACAQSITTIYTFTNSLNGALPHSALVLGPDGNLYGTTEYGGSANSGTVFKVTTNGTLTTMVNFNDADGLNPDSLRFGPGGDFYGTTGNGGIADFGTFFRMTTNGTLTTLINFVVGDGPDGALALGPDGDLYGTTYTGGGDGIVYKVTTNGALTTLASLHNGTTGGNSIAGLTLGPDGNFYGVTQVGGSGNDGTAFKVTSNGTLTVLVNFNNTNGATPVGSLALGPDGNLYGTTSSGANGSTVFKLTTNGVLTTLASFSGTNGGDPDAALTLGPDGNFFGTTYLGGSSGFGTVFKVTTSGIFTSLVSFNGANGDSPDSAVTLGPDGNFYGTTHFGGAGGNGTIFRLDLPPEFITAPTNQTVALGGSATFNGQVFGTGPFAYQWLFNGFPITGATNVILNISHVLASELGSYQLVVSNAYGSLTSQSALLLSPANIYAISNGSGGSCTVYLASQPSSTNRLWASTNPALPFAQWQLIATNVTDSNGLSQFVDTNTAGAPQKFYRLSYP